MYKIQIGFEDGFYVAYLARHYEGGLEADVIEEMENIDYYDLIDSIPYRWVSLLTNFLNN